VSGDWDMWKGKWETAENLGLEQRVTEDLSYGMHCTIYPILGPSNERRCTAAGSNLYIGRRESCCEQRPRDPGRANSCAPSERRIIV